MTRQIRFLMAALLGAAAGSVFHGSLRAQSTDPCATVLSGPSGATTGTAIQAASRPDPKSTPLDHDDRWSHLDSLWAHRAGIAQHRVAPKSVDVHSSLDVGEIAVIQNAGDLMIKPNPVDLGDVGLRFTVNAGGGYNVSAVSYGFRQPLGSSVTLADDASRDFAMPFAFSFFGVSHDGSS